MGGGLEGYWTGAFVRDGNSAQAFTVDIFKDGDTLRASLLVNDWPYYDPTVSVVEEKGRVVRFGTPYGVAELVRDSVYGEMVGACNLANVHLKRGVRPPRRKLDEMTLSFRVEGLSLPGRIVKPAGPGPWPTAILVHGRGCGSMESWDRQPEVLAQYGMAVVVFDKRGRGDFPCEETTMELHAADLARVTEQVAALPFTGAVGHVTSSAGGWVSPKAARMCQAEVAFIVSIVGPSTSVLQQQLDCARYYVREELELDEVCVDEALAYTRLMFETKDKEGAFRKMQALLASGEEKGWIDVLEESDIPATAADLPKLWVQRNNYDPSEDLKAFKGPFLSVLGGDDFVVPFRENAARFEELFEAAGKTNYRIVVAPSAGHGMEHWHELRDLGYEPEVRRWHTYFKFDRVAAESVDELVGFLREYGFID